MKDQASQVIVPGGACGSAPRGLVAAEIRNRIEHRRSLSLVALLGGFLADSDNAGLAEGCRAAIRAGDRDTAFISTSGNSCVERHFFREED